MSLPPHTDHATHARRFTMLGLLLDLVQRTIQAEQVLRMHQEILLVAIPKLEVVRSSRVPHSLYTHPRQQPPPDNSAIIILYKHHPFP
jgi:hypothetical protein